MGISWPSKARLPSSGWPWNAVVEEPPLRSELFSADQMEQHGKALARAHVLGPKRAPDQLLARLAANEKTLVGACKLLTTAITQGGQITPAGEWLLDNFYLIEEQIRTAKRHLPKGYSRQLPRLAQGPSAGQPRVYDIALETIAHGDGRVDMERLSRFVAAYQTVSVLRLGELWAIPIMLRLAVIENLRRISVRISAGWSEHNLAGTWADQMTEVAQKDPKSLILVVADMARSDPPMGSAFVAELARRLQGHGPSPALPLTWVEQRLAESGQTIEQLVQLEIQQQAADQVSISNSIGSLRVLGALDWREFVETLSVVEQTLRQDPADVYAAMDFATRDRYRHATEGIAARSPIGESEIAGMAVELARTAAMAGAAEAGGRSAHVGFYLIDRGLPELERKAGVRLSAGQALRRLMGRLPLAWYLGAIGLITVATTGGVLARANTAGVDDWTLLLIGLISLVAASHLAGALANWLATVLVTAHPLPKMDFSTGIPPPLRTLVVVPSLLTGEQELEELAGALEVTFLANRDRHVHFGLLTDFPDADQESLPQDGPLLQLARARIDALNEKYAVSRTGTGEDIFFLLHRPRRWNARERTWMGHERKRGKLADLNALLRGATWGGPNDSFSLVIGDMAVLRQVKYVITLDTDTQLPRDAARQLVGAMAHPLNRPCYDAAKGRVIEGYGILQPRVAASLPGANRSRYAWLYGGEPGIDPYTRAVSDVYQDLFREGSFIGKGIYDVDACEQALAGRFPDNRILSHDLLEGCYARAGLLSDVQLYEDYPGSYGADVSRRHRWIRGDWQLAPWLRRRVPGPDRSRYSNPLSGLSRWKIFDNFRRSLVPSALTLLLLLGWTVLPSPAFWTVLAIGTLLVPVLCVSVFDFLRKPVEMPLRQHLIASTQSASRRAMQVLFEFACLPYEAFFSLDAITRTVWRMLVTRTRLLEWNPSSQMNRELARRGRNNLAAAFRTMWIGPAIALGTGALLVATRPAALMVAAPPLLLWLASPVLAWWISRPTARRRAMLTTEQVRFLRATSRRTWAFFDTFVGPQDHWLPPDNYQEYRVAAVAHRTSPTNIGMALISGLSAYDFGYITAGQLVTRTAHTLDTMDGLDRHRGHFYNWYDTLTLQPLLPRYISTVDSGNLAGHLLTLRVGLLELPDDSLLPARLFEGLSDTFGLIANAPAAAVAEQQAAFRNTLDRACAAPPTSLRAAQRCLEQLAAAATRLTGPTAVSPGAGGGSANESEANEWAQALERQCRAALEEVTFLAPWLAQFISPCGLEAHFDDLADMAPLPSLRKLTMLELELAPRIESLLADDMTPAQRAWLADLQRNITQGSARARERMTIVDRLARQCDEFARVEYDFLFDKARHLLSIGYNVDERRMDAGYYDLLASEARLCSFVAIAQGQLSQESWFAFGRQLTGTSSGPVLLSWSGSMFEYLMPLLIMPTYENTLLDQTGKAAVARQIEYGKQRGVPWGISESGYNVVDAHLNYQYRAFGVPGLGLKRGLADDLVIAPYASAMALMVAPEASCLNLQRLAAAGFAGKFGFFEAIDYTPARQRRGQSHAVVRSFMAHHQGMTLLALAYVLLNRPMQRRFESEPMFQSVLLLLHERIPKATALFSHLAQPESVRTTVSDELPIRILSTPDTALPQVQLLSNGRYHVMVSNAGGGYSRWRDLAVTRWREDGTRDHWGTFCYVRDVASGAFWSAAHQPTLKRPDSYEAIFSEGRAEFRRRDSVDTGDGPAKTRQIETHTEIVVSPEDDIELRRVRIVNQSRQRRQIEVTSYAEVVIAPAAADAVHPAFSNLFVQTEIVRERHAILCTRRPRSMDEQVPWMLHLMVVHGAQVGEVSCETDRSRFLGRTRTAAAPLALSDSAALSDSEGSVLDPIVAIRYTLTLDPEQVATVDIVSGITDARSTSLALIEKYHDRQLADRVFDLAWTHSQVVLRQLNATEADAQLYARLASSIIYVDPSLRADAAVLVKNRRGQSGLWGYAISGDLPIVLLQIGDAANIDLVRELVQAHAYWRLKGLAVDLVIWNEDHAGYRQQLQDQIMGLIASGIEASVMDRPGGIFVRSAEQISVEDRVLFQSVARAVISDSRGTLAEQLGRRSPSAEPRALQFVPSRQPRSAAASDRAGLPARSDLILSNGLGGFTPDGREYVITLAPGQVTPAPWVNVLANPHFGSVVSESGVAYTWSENAHEFRLTPWHNDPVSDAGAEALYLRDEETGQFWSPTPLPARASTSYVIRHGFGYSVFEHLGEGIHTELWVYVATDAAVKFSVLKVRNQSGRARKLSATGYVDWVLGDLPSKSAMHVATEVDPRTGVLYARNPYNAEFADRVAFFDVDDPARKVTGDRTEFVGRNGTLRNPAAMGRARLSGKVGAGMDPCGAIQVNFDLADGQEREIVFRLGVGHSADGAAELAQRVRGSLAARGALEAVWQYWNHTLGTVQVETPDPSVNVLANGWLMYQTLACRVWARSGYYQSGGAFGFRDQLQDVMALVHAEPGLVREHLLLCASRQFLEGDVQHWWHPPSGRGVRTHCSDDYLWLPLAVCRYVASSGDTGVLDEVVPFLEGRPVNPEDDSYYDLPGRSPEAASLYEHCVRAIRHGLRFGEHGLPLIGSGDWNDGMDRVGVHGRGESVWLGFFMCAVLRQFIEVARLRDDAPFAELCAAEGSRLSQSIEQHGWDGGWYRRAYFDDGTPLGSASNAECRIDSISQSWSVLSGAGDPTRSRTAMKAVDERLVRRDHGLVQLLDPPFDTSGLDPGYIRGYVPGVRENGGQYTHGAIWAAMAFAALGERERAWELLTLINPVNHASSAPGVATYKVEPYVVAADVYAVSPHIGRGGWSWYTGSAGWMYRLIVESLLGLRLAADTLHIAPCLPPNWQGFKLHYRYRETVYHVAVTQEVVSDAAQGAAMHMTVDGVERPDQTIQLVDDRQDHAVEIRLMSPSQSMTS